VKNPAAFADRVLDQLSITSPRDLLRLEDIAWERGALVRDGRLSGAEARLTSNGRRSVITISETVVDLGRRRFGIAHELGHLEMRDKRDLLESCTAQHLNCWQKERSTGDRELLANKFAAALLLPERFFAQRCNETDPTLDVVSALAREYGVSLTATARRYSVFCEEPIAVVYSSSGFITWFQASPEFKDLGYFVNVGECPGVDSIADRIFDGKSVGRKPKQVSASNWLAAGRHNPEAVILEQSWPLTNYNAVLTLLWIEDEIDDDDLF